MSNSLCVYVGAFYIGKYLVIERSKIEAPDGVFGRWEIGVKFWDNWVILFKIFWEMGV